MPTPEELAADAAAEVPEATAGLTVLIERMVDLKASIDASEEHLRDLKADYNAVRMRYLPQALNDAGLKNARTLFGTVSIRTKTHATIPKDRRDEGREWLLAHNLGDVLTVETKALQDLVSDLTEAGRPIPDFIRVFTEETAVLTKPKGAAKA